MARAEWDPNHDHFFKVLLRDVNPSMVAAWQDAKAFGGDKYNGLVEVAMVVAS